MSAPLNLAGPHLPPPPSTISTLSTPEDTTEDTTLAGSSLKALKYARQIVRLVQCPQCSYPLQRPVTLPCGNTLCKECIPELHLRPNISYPVTANRLRGFWCPFDNCRKEHAEGDYGVDVVLTKVMHHIRTEMDAHRKSSGASEALLQAQVVDQEQKSTLHDGHEQMRENPGGQLLATYNMADGGKLAYNSEDIPAMDPLTEMDQSDTRLFGRLKESTRPEMECPVCYAVFIDPLTANCGHTLCRKCLYGVLESEYPPHLCPTCRQPMELSLGASARLAPANALLTNWLSVLFPEDLASRIETEKSDNLDGDEGPEIPLFICTVSPPHMWTYLHIFEPQYRLMIQRVMDSSTKRFGMLSYNAAREPQGDLGNVPFYEYGTLLEVNTIHSLPDGRFYLKTLGVCRFRVLSHSTLDGYTVGKVERISDISITEEEAIEAAETSAAPKEKEAPAHDQPVHKDSLEDFPAPISDDYLNALSTQEMLDTSTNFIKEMQDMDVNWLRRSTINLYGECPNDAALFPWWFATVVAPYDISSAEKYRMLKTMSVRERLKICMQWADKLKVQRSYVTPSPCVLLGCANISLFLGPLARTALSLEDVVAFSLFV